jgi:cytoskeleton protein RodZ
MTEPVQTLGPRLKAERERRGLSSQKAADELHLDGWVVDALESEDYERVGPSVYVKGHLKRYAALLELPPADIIASYESRAQAPRPPAAQPANVRLRAEAPVASNLSWVQITGSIAAVLLTVGLMWWKPWQHRGAGTTTGPLAANPSAASPDSAADSAEATPASAAGSPTPTSTSLPGPLAGSASAGSVGAAGGPVVGSKALGTPAAGSPAASAPASTSTSTSTSAPGSVVPAPTAPATADAAGVGHARLRLSFSADSWVDVHDAEGRRAFAGRGRANSVKTIAGDAPMRVYLGFASGVQLEINNRAVAIGPQFVAGDVARFEAGADGVLRRDSRSVAPPPAVQTRNARPTG